MNDCHVCNTVLYCTEDECRLSDREESRDLRKHLKDRVGYGDRIWVPEGMIRN